MKGEKDNRDMEAHLESPFWVFVSLKSGIAEQGKAAVDIQWTKHHQMVVLVQRFKEHDLKFVLGVLKSLSDVALNIFRERANRTESSTLIEYERKMAGFKYFRLPEIK